MRAIAKAAGISEGWLRQIERGYELTGGVKVPARPSDKVLVRVALIVGVSPEHLFGAIGRPVDQHVVAEVVSEMGFGADPDALKEGHGGTEGWPRWLEEKFVGNQEDQAMATGVVADDLRDLRQEVRDGFAALRQEIEDLSRRIDGAGAERPA